MNKNVLIGIAVFGGILLVSALLSDTPTNEQEQVINAEVTTQGLPTEVSANFPTYPASKVLNLRKTDGDDGRIFYSLSLEVTATKAEINTWYREALSQNGWSIKSDKNVAGYQIIQAEKDNLYTSMQAAGSDTAGGAVISQQAQVRPVVVE